MLIQTVIFLFFLFLTYAIFLLTSRKSDARQERLQKRVAEALQDFSAQEHEIQISRESFALPFRESPPDFRRSLAEYAWR